MKILLAFVLASFLVGCNGCGRKGEEELEIDPELRPMLELYLKNAPNEGRLAKLRSFKFGTPHGDDLGNCEWNRDNFLGRNQVELRIVILRSTNEFEYAWKKTALHELGHCLHELPHSDDPESLMYPGNEHEAEYWENKLPEAVRELF